jgi:hypothetical protein
LDELLQIIRQEEPPRPSVRLSSHASLPTIAANRTTEPKKLCLLVRGDLDWIVMKALEKDRSRRYETANEFAHDIRRYLADDIVHARPPSARYRLQKYARRHRTLLASGSAVVVTLLLGLVATTAALVSAKEANLQLNRSLVRLNNDAQVNALRIHQLSCYRDSTEQLLGVISREIGNDPRLDSNARRELQEKVLTFWTGRVGADGPHDGISFHAKCDRVQRALCLARLGRHELAFEDARLLRQESQQDLRMREWTNDIIRVCALCAEAAKDDPELAAFYLESGIEYADVAADVADTKPPSDEDPDLETLKSNKAFQDILQRWWGNWKAKTRGSVTH